MCMGSNLGPTMAAFAMHMLEANIGRKPIYYKRYVDDIFAIFENKNDSEEFFKRLNILHTDIKFTMEEENNNVIEFLDMQLIKSDNKILIKWLMKKTNTGTYLHKTAYSPMSHKLAAMRSLIFRAYKLSSNIEYFEEAYKIIESIFINNGYHYRQIEKQKYKVINKINTMSNASNDEQPKIAYWTLPYVQTVENFTKKTVKSINEICQPSIKLRLAYICTKSSSFLPNKDKVSKDLQSNVVYQYVCDQCSGHTYTGETTRHFSTRRNEHMRGKPVATEISLHHHALKKENFTIILRTRHTFIAEALINQKVLPQNRLNNYAPPFKLQLFNVISHVPTST